MTISKNVVNASRVMSKLALAGAVLYIVGEILVFLDPDLMNAVGFVEMHHTGEKVTNAIPLLYRLGALAIEAVPTALVVWALLELRLLFLSYAGGDVFSATALKHLSRVAVLMFWYVPVSFVLELPVSALLTWERGAGHREASLTLSSSDISFLFMAGVVLVIARVMAEARRLADENAGFV